MEKPSGSYNRVKRFSVCFDQNFTKGTIKTVGWRDNYALPIKELHLEKQDLCKDEFHRRKQLAKITTKTFLELGFIHGEELLEELMDKNLLHPARVILVATMFDRNKYEANKK